MKITKTFGLEIMGITVLTLISFMGMLEYANAQQQNVTNNEWIKTESGEVNPLYNITLTNYTSPVLGITFEVPVNWTFVEKSNRFEEGADVYATPSNAFYQGYISFTITKYNPLLSQDIKDKGLENASLEFMKRDALNPDVKLFEGINTTKYKIDGYDTATYLKRIPNDLNTLYSVIRTFIVNENGFAWIMYYENTPARFDSPESQEIMNHIVNSITFS